jgi:hypothetical protein
VLTDSIAIPPIDFPGWNILRRRCVAGAKFCVTWPELKNLLLNHRTALPVGHTRPTA